MNRELELTQSARYEVMHWLSNQVECYAAKAAVLLIALLGIASIIGSGGGGGGECSGIFANVVPFSFKSVNNAALNTEFTSEEVKITRCGSKEVSISGDGEYSVNGGPFTRKTGQMSPNSSVRVRVVSASTFDTTTSVSFHVHDGIDGLTRFLFGISASATFSVRTISGDPADAPTAQISSPADQESVNARTIVVTGQANDPDGVYSIEVNSIEATSANGYATWQAEIPLVYGVNVITVVSTDSLFNKNPTAAQIQIGNLAAILAEPKAIETDTSNLRLLVADRGLGAVVAINFLDGAHSILSEPQMPDVNVPITEPWKLAVNAAGTVAWIIDRAYDDLVRVDLGTGQRSLVTDTVGMGLDERIGDAKDLVIDEISARALLLFGEFDDARIIAVDLLTGAQAVLSDATTPNADNAFAQPISMALDPISNRLLVAQHSDAFLDVLAIIAVDPTTGQRSVVIDATQGVGDPRDVELDSVNGRILIVNRFGEVLSLDLMTDELTILWAATPRLGDPIQLEIDPYNQRALTLHTNNKDLGAIDLITGVPSVAY